jgi:hypothetical protein
VLLIGMRMPPNLGRDYTQGFERNFSELSKLHKTAFLPFLLGRGAGRVGLGRRRVQRQVRLRRCAMLRSAFSAGDGLADTRLARALLGGGIDAPGFGDGVIGQVVIPRYECERPAWGQTGWEGV